MNKLNSIMARLHNPNLGILLIRVALGIVFLNAGWMKLNNLDQIVAGFASMGIPAALAYFVSLAEFLGGAALILGIFVRYAGIILAIIMLVACKILSAKGFSLAQGGFEYPFVLMLCSLAIAALGEGEYTLPNLIQKK